MKIRKLAYVAAVTSCALLIDVSAANAFCGVAQGSATGKNVNRAKNNAEDAVRAQLKPIRKKYGKKFVPSEPQIGCVGGAIAIDANGNQIEGKPSCTVTISYCVNP